MKRVRPILLGIAGDSASGKTTIAEGIVSVLGRDRVTSLCCDDYHKYTRAQRKAKGVSALDPRSNFIDIMQNNFLQLRKGEAILKPVYDHEVGDFRPPEYIEPKDFVIVEGLLAFHTRKMRDAFDVKIYLDPQEELRVDWMFKRNTTKRGYSLDEMRESLARRQGHSERFIHPQRRFADIVVRFHQPKTGANGDPLNADLILRPTIRHPDFTEFIDQRPQRRERCLAITLGRDQGMPVDILNITGSIQPVTADTLMEIIIDHLPVRDTIVTMDVGAYWEGTEKRMSRPLGITQLLTCYHLLNAQIKAG
ncbi:MAG: phosphoribulokinase [Desulfovibrio sp.]|nr:MAG: phosphoribulokinase [Desulfovibrio sp.]